MSNAHKGSKLILKDALIPVDFSSAHFDYNVDATGIQYGNLIEPLSGSVYTMRPKEGKFGGGIAVEEGTTNLAVISNSNWSINKSNYQGTVLVTTPNNIDFLTSALFDFEPKSNISGSGWQVAQYNHGVSAWQTGNVYTWSIYCKRFTNDNIQVALVDGNGTNKQGESYYFGGNIGEWQRGSITWTPTTTSGGSLFYVTANDTAKFELANPQIEKKQFMTSVVDGLRNKGVLKYNDSIISEQQGTVSFWYKPYIKWEDTTTSNGSNEGTVEYFLTWGTPGQNNSLWARRVRDSKTIVFYYNGVGTSYSYSSNLTGNDFTHITYTWKSGLQELYINGAKVSASSTLTMSRPTTGFIEIAGRGNGATFPNGNGIFSDLRIDTTYMSSEDISACFISQKPYYNPYDYRSFSY